MEVLTAVFAGLGLLLPLAAVFLPTNRLPLVIAAAVADIAWLSLYAFGEDDYTSDGRSRWQTHGSTGSHAFYVVAVAFWVILAASAVALSRRGRAALPIVALSMSAATVVLWFGAHFAFDNN